MESEALEWVAIEASQNAARSTMKQGANQKIKSGYDK